jgi:hypothetical protein
MEPLVIAAIAVMVGVGGVGLVIFLAQNRKALRKAAALLDEAVIEGSSSDPETPVNQARGRRRGIELAYILLDTSTQVVATIAETTFTLELRQRTTTSPTDSGRLGDRELDEVFVVEAEPVEVARRLLRSGIRDALLRLVPTRLDIRKSHITLERTGLQRNAGWIRGSLELVARLTEGLPAAIAGEDVGPYRAG